MEELIIDAAICSDYEKLLKESQRGLVAWRERRGCREKTSATSCKNCRQIMRPRITGWNSTEKPASSASSRLV
jgi:hypothetical protein